MVNIQMMISFHIIRLEPEFYVKILLGRTDVYI